MADKKKPRFHLPYPLFDTHFHALHMSERFEDAESVIDFALEKGLIGGIEVAVDELNFDNRISLITDRQALKLSAGIHPSSSGSDVQLWEERFDIIRRQSAHDSVVAIGETGLDFYRHHSPRDVQEYAFSGHLELASDTGLPVIIHNRDADDRVLCLVAESRCRKGVFHCFSSDWKTAKKALDLGFYLSFAGNVTYKNAEILRDAASRVPLERLLIETDAPYLSPVPVRGRDNHPGHLGYTLEAISEARREDSMIVAEAAVENAYRLFNL